MPIHHTVGVHSEPLRTADQRVAQRLNRQVGVTGFQCVGQLQPLDDTAGAGVDPDWRLIALRHDDHELKGGRYRPVARKNQYEIGARSLSLRRNPSHHTIGAHGEPHRTLHQTVGDGLGDRIWIGRLEVEGEAQPFSDPAGCYGSPNRRTVQAGANAETDSGRRQADSQVPVAAQRGQITSSQDRHPLRQRAGLSIRKGDRGQGQRLIRAHGHIGLSGQLIEFKGDRGDIARVPVNEFQIDRPVGGHGLEPNLIGERLEDRIPKSEFGRDGVGSGQTIHAGDREIPTPARQSHRRRIGRHQEVLVPGIGLVTLVLKVGGRRHGQSAARTQDQVLGGPTGPHPQCGYVCRQGDVIEVLVGPRMAGCDGLTRLQLLDAATLLDGGDSIGGPRNARGVGHRQIPQTWSQGHRLAVQVNNQSLVGGPRRGGSVVILANTRQLGSPNGVQIHISRRARHREGNPQDVAGGHLIGIILLQNGSGIGDPNGDAVGQRGDTDTEVRLDGKLIGGGPTSAPHRQIIALPTRKQRRKINVESARREATCRQAGNHRHRVGLRGIWQTRGAVEHREQTA